MYKWFYLPALLFLNLTLISGIWLRLQWGWPGWMIFRADYLIHGHSHVALLGWVFLGLAGFMLESGACRKRLSPWMVTLSGGALTLTTILLFAAFVREGYAPLSIALSTLHMLLGYLVAGLFFYYARQDSYRAGQYFLEGAVFWMLISTAGTWLLAVGRGLPPFWMDAAVAFYLHILFNGWFVFALAGLAFRYLLPPERKDTIWPFWLMMAGLIPALVPQLEMESYLGATGITGLITFTGLAGSLLYAAGGLAVVWFVIRSEVVKSRRWFCRELIWTGLAGAVLVFVLPVAMAWPPFRDFWLQSDFLVIGFIHVHLLVMVTSLLLFAIIQRVASGNKSRSLRSRNLGRLQVISAGFGMKPVRSLSEIIRRTGSVLYLAGSVSMAGVLLSTGIFQVSGIIPPFPVQKVLFYTGFIALSGVIALTATLRR